MGLDNFRIGGLAQNFQQVVVADEVEPGKSGSLLLQKLRQRFLASL